MDLIQIVRENPRARLIILAQNEADTMRKYGLTLSQARQVHQYAAMLEAAE
jgi:hypothetical protein